MQYRLRGMATFEEFRRLGAGKPVVNYAENLIKEQGFDFLCLKQEPQYKNIIINKALNYMVIFLIFLLLGHIL